MLQKLEEDFGSAPVQPDIAELKRILLLRIVDLERNDPAEPSLTENPIGSL